MPVLIDSNGSVVQVNSDALAEMKKKQNTESLRITELQGLIANMKDEIEVKVRHTPMLALSKSQRGILVKGTGWGF